jgi:hypothetical protein
MNTTGQSNEPTREEIDHTTDPVVLEFGSES